MNSEKDDFDSASHSSSSQGESLIAKHKKNMKKKIIIADMLKQLEIWSKLILNALKKEAFQCIVKESDKKLDKESRKFKITQYKQSSESDFNSEQNMNQHEQLLIELEGQKEKNISQASTNYSNSKSQILFLNKVQSNEGLSEQEDKVYEYEEYEQEVYLNPANQVKNRIFRIRVLLIFNIDDTENGIVKDMFNKYNSELPIQQSQRIQKASKQLLPKYESTNWTVLIHSEVDNFEINVRKALVLKPIKQIIIFGRQNIFKKDDPNFNICEDTQELNSYLDKERDLRKVRPQLPNFSFFETNYRKKNFSSTYNFRGFLEEFKNKKNIQIIRKRALEDFIVLAKACSSNFSRLKFEKDIESFESQYPISLDLNNLQKVIEICFKWYTRQSFFFRVLNIGLRVLHNPQDAYYFRIIGNDIFLSIQHLYKKNNKKIKKCYRGFSLSNDEIKYFEQKNSESYIQSEGYFSTSLSQETAISYASNGVLQIIIPQEKQNSDLNQFETGFADISSYSKFANQEEILFNALNTFKFKSIKKQKSKHKQYYKIVLEYGFSQNKSSKLYEIKLYRKFHEKIENKIKNQGDIIYYLKRSNAAKLYYEKCEKRIQKTKRVFLKDRIRVYNRLADIYFDYDNIKCADYMHKLQKIIMENLSKIKNMKKAFKIQIFTHFSVLLLRKNPHSYLSWTQREQKVKSYQNNGEAQDKQKVKKQKEGDVQKILTPLKRNLQNITDNDEKNYGELTVTRNAYNNNIGALYAQYNNFKKGLQNLKKCELLYQENQGLDNQQENKALNDYQEAAMCNNIALCYMEVARALQKSKDKDLQQNGINSLECWIKSIHNFQKCLNIFQKQGLIDSTCGTVHYNIASYYFQKKSNQIIDEKIKESDKQFKSRDQYRYYELNLAKIYLQKSKKIYLTDSLLELLVERKLCEVQIILENEKQAKKYFKQAQKMIDKLKSIQIHNKQTKKKEQLRKDYYLQKKQEKIREQLSDYPFELLEILQDQIEQNEINIYSAIINNNYGMLNLYKDKIEDAFESFKKSWLITEKMTNKWNKKQIEMLKIDILNNIGSIHLQKSNFEKTDEYFKLADKKIIDYNQESYYSFFNNKALVRFRKKEFHSFIELIYHEDLQQFNKFKQFVKGKYL